VAGLNTRCILTPREDRYEYRLSVMSRHTLPNGIDPDPRITKDLWDRHADHLAPPSPLVRDYYRDLAKAQHEEDRLRAWLKLESDYCDYLENLDVRREIERVTEIALRRSVTLLCIEEQPHRCHRRLLAEACQALMPGLEVSLR